MKRLSIIPVCLLVLSSFAFAQDTTSEGASTSVAEELSEEAAILRALVEEYKAKKEGGVQPNQIEKPPIPTAPVDPASSTTPVTDAVDEKMDAAGEKAAEKIDSVTNLISNPIESVDSVIPSTPPAMSNIPRIDAPVIDRSEIPPLEAPANTAPVVPRLETPIVDKSEIPPLEEPAATVAEMPNVTAPTVSKSGIPAIEEPKPTEADRPKVSAPALSNSEMPVIEDSRPTSADKPKEEIVVVKTEIPSLDQPKSETAPAAEMKTAASSLSDSIILNDAPSPTPKVEVPVTTPMKQETANQSAAPA
ncbi:MAG: hypothetical protein P1V20_31355, partial [Verrucomicrobiales bacterium]|nr:hypothetical protein [Verrucomicrobiales bacterium]